MHCAFVLALALAGLGLCSAALDCTGKADGNYHDPDSSCSQIYWTCTNGIGKIKFCEDGMAYFDRNDTCTDPKMMLECSTPNSAGSPNIDCLNRADGDYPNNGSMCSQVSGISCRGGVKSVRYCWLTTRFDPLSQHCLFQKHMKVCGAENDLIAPVDNTPQQPIPQELQYDCMKKVGNFPNPQMPCSNLYIICSPNGLPSVGQCPAGTVYDADFDWCQYSQYVVACGGHPQPVTSSSDSTTVSAMPTTTLTPSSSFNCDGLDLGYYANPDAPCSGIYYACTGGKWGLPESCPDGTFYDRVLRLCTYHDDIPECGGTRPNATVLPGAAAPEPIAFDCSNLKSGNYPEPTKTSGCSRFFITCTLAGKAFRQTCPINTFYDKDLDQCLFYAQVPACSGTPRPNATALPMGTQPPTVLPFSCTGKQDRNYLPMDQDCSDIFYECSNGVTYRLQCPPGLKYDEYSDQCLHDEDVFGCPNYKSRSSFCLSKPVNGIYAYPGQCNSFIFCISGLEAVLNCPADSVFNSRTNTCDKKTLVSPPCGTGPTPPIMTCANQPAGVYWDGNDCSVYVVCGADGSQTITHCPEGFAFNPMFKNCTQASLVPKCFPQQQPDMLKFCQNLPNGIFAFPGNCRRALFCLDNAAYLFYCSDPAMPYWDPIAHKCSPATTSCTSSISL